MTNQSPRSRRRKRTKADRAFTRLIKSQCNSLWEGCCCTYPKGHLEKHRCAAPNCGCTWTDEQEAKWWAEEAYRKDF